MPADIFISSAVKGPMTSFFLRRTYWIIASLNESPPIRNDSLTTTPVSQRTAISVVPPPISTTIAPTLSASFKFVPIAAAKGSSIRTVFLAPVRNNASRIARFSTGVIPDGTQTTIRVFIRRDAGTTERIKYFSINSVMS